MQNDEWGDKNMKRNMQFLRNFLSVIMFCMMLQSSQGTFYKNIFEKPFKISHMTKNFLQQSITFQQDFLKQREICQLPDASCVRVVHSMKQLNQQILFSQEISKKAQSDLFSIVNLARQTLFEQQVATFCDLKDQVFKSWWNFLEKSLDAVQVRGYEQDFVWLCAQIAQLMYSYRLNVDATQLKTKMISSVTICQDLMHKFNGLLVNDYDLLVLGNVAVALLAMRC